MSFKNNVLEGSGLDFGGPRARYWRVWGLFFETFASFLTCCLEDVPPIFPPEIPPHVGRADAPKKVRICRVTERQPRIARLPHLKIQTPRTPRTSRTPRVKSSTTTAENKRVGRRWSPPGGLQYFLCRRPRTKLSPQVGRRLEQGWPYYFLCRRPWTKLQQQVGRRL